MFAYLSHKLRFLSKRSFFLLLVMLLSFFYNKIDEARYSNCIIKDVKFLRIEGSNSMVFNIPNLKIAKKQRREFKVFFEDVKFPTVFDKSSCTNFQIKKLESHVVSSFLTGRNITLSLDQCKLSISESKGRIYINDKNFIESMVENKIIAKKPRWWQIFSKSPEWCEYHL